MIWTVELGWIRITIEIAEMYILNNYIWTNKLLKVQASVIIL